jgi:hypothetical protein
MAKSMLKLGATPVRTSSDEGDSAGRSEMLTRWRLN